MVSCVSDRSWTKLTEDEEIRMLRNSLPDDINEVYTALNNHPLFTGASFILEEGRIVVESLEDFGKKADWVSRFKWPFVPVLPVWTISKAVQEYEAVPKLPPHKAILNKSCLALIKSLQTTKKLWSRMWEEEEARERLFSEEILADEDDDVFNEGEGGDGEDQGEGGEQGSGEDQGESGEHGAEEGRDEENGASEAGPSGTARDDDDILEIHTSDDDRKSLGEEDDGFVRYEGNVRVMRAKLIKNSLPRKSTDVRKKYSAI